LAGRRKRRKKKKGSAAVRAVRTAYRTLVAVSAVIVTVFVVGNILIRAPEVGGAPAPTPSPEASAPAPGATASQLGEGAVGAPVLERKDRFYTFLLAASDQVSGNADTIMVASYDVPNQRVALVSIPRDTLVDRAWDGNHYHKINGAYAFGGIGELRSAVSEMLGIPIDFTVTVDLRAFVEVVDAVGGVDFYVPIDMNYDAPDQDLHIHYDKGLHTGLTGQQVLEIARCRKNSDAPGLYPENTYDAYAGSGTNREETQRGLMKAIAQKLLSWGSIPKITTFAEIFQRNVHTDMEWNDILYFATAAMQMDLSTGFTSAIFPGAGDVTYKGTHWCWEYDREAALELINAHLDPYTTPITMDMTHMVQAE